MLKKKVKYVDFNGKTQEEVVYFNLTEPEAVRLQAQYPEGLEAHVAQFDPDKNPAEIVEFFETLFEMAYGEKSEDGKFFLKDKEKTELFKQSAAYSALYMELISDADVAVDFFTGLLSKTVVPSEKVREN